MSAYLVKANLLTKVAKSIGKNFVILSSATDEGVDFKKIETATYGCKACKTQFASAKGHEPFCVNCSSIEVEEITSNLPSEDLAKYKDDEVACVQCASCKTFNIMSMQTATLLDTKLNCVQCGTEITYDLPEDENLENPDIVSDELPVEDTDLENDDTEEETEIFEEEMNSEETSELNENDHTGTDAPETKTDIDTAIGTGEVKTPEVKEQELPEVSPDNSKISDTGTGDQGLKVTDSEEVALLDLVEGQLTFDRFGEKIIAQVNNIPVAVLTREKAVGETASYFSSRAIIPAIEHTVKVTSPKQALAYYNFELSKVKIPVPAIVESRVKSEVAKVESEISSKLKEINEDFNQCLALASVALSKNAFKGKTNILKASLIENMSSMGIRGAEKIVSNIFAQHSQEYHKALLEMANSLMSKSIEHRNELAETLDVLNPVEDEEFEDSEEDSEEDNDIEARLEKASISSRKPNEPRKVNLGQSEVASIVSELRNKNQGLMFTKRF